VVLAAVERRAARARGDAGLVQDGHRLVLSQGALKRTQLSVDVAERAQLGDHERVVALSEAVQIEDQPAEVAIGELTRLAQEARTSPRTATRAEAGLLGITDGAHRLALLRRRRGSGLRSRGGWLVHGRSMLAGRLKRRAPCGGHPLGHLVR
jgi:hypothetical protein